jgi:HEPN domain-containing protein
MNKGFGLVKGASKNFELARRYKKEGDVAVATLLYNKAVSGVMRAIYLNKTGKSAPTGASIGYLASKTELPIEVEQYIASVMETGNEEEELEALALGDAEQRKSRTESSLLYIDGLVKRLLDNAMV